MPRFYGTVGFIETVETAPGVWTEEITERQYSGEILRMSKSWQSGEHLNDNLQVNVQIRFVADPYAFQHFHSLRYIDWMGARWKISTAEPLYPGITVTLGGVYNGPEA